MENRIYTWPKDKEFKWRYSSYDGLVINRSFKNGNHETVFSDKGIKKVINYIKKKERIPLANNVEKLTNGTEKEGLGSFIYQNISKNTADAQAESHLASIMYNLGIFGYIGALRDMEFWLIDDNRKKKL